MRVMRALLLAFASAFGVVAATGALRCAGSPSVDAGSDASEAGCDHDGRVAVCDAGWCSLPHGCFLMGSPEGEPGRGRYSENLHPVTLTHDFEIMQYEVTQGMWVDAGLPDPTLLGDGGADYALHHPAAPVGNVTFSDAHAYANLLSKRHVPQLPECYVLGGCDGGIGADLHCSSIISSVANIYLCQGYRLATEAEWEYAARAGTTDAYYTGDSTGGTTCQDDQALDPAAWYCQNSGFTTHVVGLKQANAFQLFDMLGNAGEWVEDKFNGLGYGDEAAVDPGAVLVENTDQVVRGGFVTAPPAVCRAANRFEVGNPKFLRGGAIGLRLVRTL